LDDLRKLGDLRDSGVLTQEEFEAEKARVLVGTEDVGSDVDQAPAVPPPPSKALDPDPDPLVESPRDASAPITLEDPNWRTAANGLNVLYIGVAVVFFSALVGGILAAASASQPLAVLTGILVMGGLICVIVGQYMAIYVPAPSGGRGLALTVAILTTLAVLLGVAAAVPSRASGGLDGLGNLLGLAATICFPIFIKKVSDHLGNTNLSQSAVGFLVFNIALIVVMIVIAAIAASQHTARRGLGYGSSGSGAAALGMGVGILALIGMVVWLIWYLRITRGLRDTIRERLPSRPQ
jgi:hypothetical protein